ncbi:MAG: aldo/keto reductase [Proteobacteria bacterium]|nr:aldo/keto reductase [Pseudomonadota bacterium]
MDTASAGAVRLGKSDLVVGPVAYGCWRLARGDARQARVNLETALDCGFTLVDTADVYGLDDGQPFGAAEALLGEVLRAAPALRHRMVLATKGGIVPGVPYDSGAEALRRACLASLERLGVDVIDLYQIHRPDWLAHPEEVAGCLTELRQSGRVREFGVSNYTVDQFEALQAHLPFALVTHQPEFSAWCLDPLRNGVLDQCLRRGVTPLAWSPLAGGRLGLAAEAARREVGGDRLAAVIAHLDALARDRRVPRSAAALAFLRRHPARVVPIVGSQRPERIRECARAVEITLSRSEWYAVVEAAQGEALP